jgi:hypothetical protein
MPFCAHDRCMPHHRWGYLAPAIPSLANSGKNVTRPNRELLAGYFLPAGLHPKSGDLHCTSLIKILYNLYYVK